MEINKTYIDSMEKKILPQCKIARGFFQTDTGLKNNNGGGQDK